MICDNCLHADVCGEEGAFEPALTYCADFLGWIPVSERLPEDGRPVLIYAWNVHHVIARYDEFRTADGYKKTWVTSDAWNGNTEIKHEVIAWMPLPKPYEPQERNE